MSLYRYTGSKVWTLDFMFHGQRIRESTGTRSKTLARQIELKRRSALEEGSAGIRKHHQPQLVSAAAEEWQETKQLTWSPKMQEIAKNSFRHLCVVFGKKLVVDIDARDISKYQKARLGEGASNRTVNIEVGMLRQLMRKHGVWARIQSDVKMLAERQDVGRALTPNEESTLLLECGRSRSRILFPFVVLALETGARFNTIRTLQWRNIDFAERSLRFGKDKTPSGTGRTVPLNQRAIETLNFWAQQFPKRSPEHHVFPFERYAATGAEERFGFTAASVLCTDPTEPIGNIKEAWEGAKRRTRRHCPNCAGGILKDIEKPGARLVCIACRWEASQLPAGLVSVRFHDLRHSAVSRMIAARVPLPIIAKIVGWSAGTMAKMAARYGHFGIEELRTAVEAITRTSNPAPASPVFSPVSVTSSRVV